MPVLDHAAAIPTATQKGFTLVELVIGMVVFAIALTFVTTLIFPLSSRSIDPIMQVRATELANTILNEIGSKSFDENSVGEAFCNDDKNGDGDLDDAGEQACTLAANFGPDSGEFRTSTTSNYDDVDDYHQLRQGAGEATSIIRNSLGEDLTVDGESVYAGFSFVVNVSYLNFASNAKVVTVVVSTPGGQDLVFSTIKSNIG